MEIKTRSNLRYPAFSFMIVAVIIGPLMISCTVEEHTYDGSGSFEATEVVVSSEATGILQELRIHEGQLLNKDETVGIIDTTLLHLQQEEILAEMKSVVQGIPDIEAQTRYFDQQIKLANINLSHLEKEQDRIRNLVQGAAATQKQSDELDARVAQAGQQIHVLQNQKEAQISALHTQKSGIEAKPIPLEVRLKEIKERIRRSRIVNPRKGSVLETYAEAGEYTTPGKPIYRIADLSSMYLRAFITAGQYDIIRLNQEVTILSDDGSGDYYQDTGIITWISREAEFTPKTIRTKEERENLVYAIKIAVPNDGRYKIGMYGEVKF